ncbi:protein-disulfide reductase DsbD [Gammaproteobacteria bacterium AS21]
MIFSNKFKMLCLLLLTISGMANAGIFGSSTRSDPVHVDEAFTLQIEPITENQYLLRWDILDDYYLYDNRMSFSVGDGITIKEMSRSPTKPKDDPLFGKVDVYYHSSEVVLQFNNVSEAKTIDLRINYQGCWDGGVCYPPVTKDVAIDLIKSNDSNTVNDTASIANVAADSSDEVAATLIASGVASEQDYFSDLLADGNFVWIIAAFFVAGLALSLTPCVFPMIPIISSIIAGQGKQVSKRKAFYLSAIYVLSLAFTYTLAGIFAGLFGENLQILFQVPWIIASFSIVFVLLALSMFGFYELQLPSALQSKLASLSNSQQGGDYLGVAIMGVLSALIVGPCMAAPLAGALIYIGQTADPVLGGMALFSLSIGMGVPILIAGVSAGHFMPKVGGWMNSVKAAFGVLLILMAIYTLDRIVSLEVTMLLTAITLIISAIYMGALNFVKEPDNKRTFIKGIGLVILVYAMSLFIGVLVGNGNFLKPLKGLAGSASVAVNEHKNNFVTITTIDQLTPILASAQREQRPVMLDFYADWCISCVEVELMFEQAKVANELAKMTLVKVDLTDFNDESRKLLKKYQVIGPPAIIFYNRNGVLEKNMSIVGVVSADDFVEHLQPLF